MDIFFSLFSRSSVTLLILIKKMAIATITNLPPCSMQVSLKNTRVNLRIRDRIYTMSLLRMVKDGGWKPTADLYNTYLVPIPVCATI